MNMQRPMISLLAALGAGIIIANWIQLHDTYVFFLSFAIMIILAYSLVKKKSRVLICCVIILLLLLGILNTNLYLHPRPSKNDISNHAGEASIAVEGLVIEPPRVSPYRTNITIETTRILKNGVSSPVDGKVLLSVRDNQLPLEYGDYIRAKTILKRPHSFNNPGSFDYKKYLLSQGVHLRGSVSKPSNIIIVRKNRGKIFRMHIERYRSGLMKLISDNSPAPEDKILQALILGEKRLIPDDIVEKFNRTGITHILAISGLHIGIIATIFFFIIRKSMKSSEYLLLRFNIAKVSALFVVIPIIFYALISGLGISTIRATIMILFFLTALFLGRERDFLNTLAFAAFIILAVTPMSLFDVSFQLSFIAVAAILVITPVSGTLIPDWAGKGYSGVTKPISIAILFILVSISAIIGTAPLIAFYFNRISTISLLSNIMVIPIMGVIVLPIGIMVTVIAPLSNTVAAFMIKIASFFVGISLSIIDFLGSFSFASFSVTTPTIPEIVFYYLFFITGLMLIKKWKENKEGSMLSLKISLAVIILFFLADGFYVHLRNSDPDNLEITFIDVGQGSSSLIKVPGGKKILVDGGGFYGRGFDVGRYVVAPFLFHERIKNLDVVVLTHPDQDHLGGLVYILNHFNIGEVWSNGEESDSEIYQNFKRVIEEKNIPFKIISRNTPEIKMGDVVINILNPPEPLSHQIQNGSIFDSNNNSIVMKISLHDRSILLTSDISEPAEKRLLEHGGNIKSSVILAPHHGAYLSGSEPFLKLVHPEFAVFSCGFENTFGFPDPDVLSRYKKIGITIFRTDLEGAVTVKTDGTGIEVKSKYRGARNS